MSLVSNWTVNPIDIPNGTATSVESRGLQSLSDEELQRKYQAGWQKVIDSKIIEWGIAGNDAFDDEELVRPTKAALRSACAVSQRLSRDGLPPPTHVVPDADGGVVLESRSKHLVETFHIKDCGDIEFYVLQHGKIVFRANQLF